MKILFLHGFGATPGGTKPTFLKANGFAVCNPLLPNDDFDACVRIAQAEWERYQPDVIVGSSRGGAIALNIDSGQTPLVLLCPAWKRWGRAPTVKPNTLILHAEADEAVPFAHSVELVRRSGLPDSALIRTGSEHRLIDPDSLDSLLRAIARLAGSGEEKGASDG